jgi:esterase/lipase
LLLIIIVSEINMPGMVIRSKGDPVVDPLGSKELYENIAGHDKVYRLFDLERHGILLGEGSKAVHSAIGNFCRQVASSLPTPW